MPQVFAPPANRVTVELASDVGSPTYASVGCILSIDTLPEKRTEGEETLCVSDAARLKTFNPTHMTLGLFEATVKYNETGIAALQALHGIDGTTKAFKPALLRIKWDSTDPADAQASLVLAGYVTHVTMDPMGDGSGILKFKFGFQVTADPTYTFPA